MTVPANDQTSSRSVLLIFGLLILLLLGGSILVMAARPEPVQIVINPPLPTATAGPTGTPAPITVYITGAIAQPQSVIVLPAGSRVQDALDAAGGVTADADLTRVNLAAGLRDGDQVHVPALAASAEAEVLPTRPGGNLVAINSATFEELQQLPGVGPALAERIIAYREANGAFAELAELDEIDGIGPALLEQIAPLILFE